MNTKGLIILIGAIMLFSATAHAQKVVTEGSGGTIKVIIDASGISHTTVKKVLTTKATSITSVPVNDITDLASQKSNEMVYKKFEVSKVDNSTRVYWLDAINLCANLTYNGSTGWRMPTQRELMLIWVLHNDLKALGTIFSPFILGGYWSSTEITSTVSMYVSFATGYTGDLGKIASTRVRCVRDI